MDSRPITILIIEGNDMDRLGIMAILQKDIAACILETVDIVSLDQYMIIHSPRLVVLGADAPGVDAQKILCQLLSVNPFLDVLVLSELKEEIYGKNFMVLGASGFLQKNSSPKELVKAINLILSGNLYMRKEMQAMYLGGSLGNGASPVYASLTKRELEVLKHLVLGETVYAIARKLKLSPSTIGTHKAHIFAKMNVSSILQLNNIADQFPIN